MIRRPVLLCALSAALAVGCSDAPRPLPKVTGLRVSEAERVLHQAGLPYRLVYVISRPPNVPSRTVVSESWGRAEGSDAKVVVLAVT